jgi:hypothetical protein
VFHFLKIAHIRAQNTLLKGCFEQPCFDFNILKMLIFVIIFYYEF